VLSRARARITRPIVLLIASGLRDMGRVRDRLDATLEAARPALERQGIYELGTRGVSRTASSEPCVVVGNAFVLG
jgi:hypothetical protein